jgi:Zn-dependent protease
MWLSLLSLVVSAAVVSYGLGWPIGVGLTLLIAVHECGHMWAFRRNGMETSMPVFIPFLGALISLKAPAPSVYAEAEGAIAGPLWGAYSAMVLLAVAGFFPTKTICTLAGIACAINAFNLTPLSPMDGGRVVKAVSRWLHLPGLAVIGAAAYWAPRWIWWVILVLAALDLVATRAEPEGYYAGLTLRQRLGMAGCWLGLWVVLLVGVVAAVRISP